MLQALNVHTPQNTITPARTWTRRGKVGCFKANSFSFRVQVPVTLMCSVTTTAVHTAKHVNLQADQHCGHLHLVGRLDLCIARGRCCGHRGEGSMQVAADGVIGCASSGVREVMWRASSGVREVMWRASSGVRAVMWRASSDGACKQ